MNKEKILVTAALPYANGPIHLGHLAGAYLPADIYVRYQRLKGRDVLFICGSDEHGVPITITADKEGITPRQVIDRFHSINEESFRRFGMSFDIYSRTSLPLHHETAREFFSEFHGRGLLNEKKSMQFYDEAAKMFLPDRYVEGTCPNCGNEAARSDECENCGALYEPSALKNPVSKISGKTPVLKETSHWYFPLGNYQQRLEEYIAARSRQFGWKDNVLQYCNGWFKDGLKDRAVTRDLDWGVPVPLPEAHGKVLYVWFEAVLGYISATKELFRRKGDVSSWKDYWQHPDTKYIAFIGKDNIVFHTIVFPSMLMAWNDGDSAGKYILPQNVPANEFLNFEGKKFSKSRHWGIDVIDFLNLFPADALRYTLASNLPELRDTDFYWKEFQARYNNELADILGNFINRTFTFVHKHFSGQVPPLYSLNDMDKEMLNLLENHPAKVGGLFEQYRFKEATFEIINLARAGNKYFNDAEPWVTVKQDKERCATTLHICLQAIYALAELAAPVLPHAADAIFSMLNAAQRPWDECGAYNLQERHLLGQPGILFKKIEDDVIEQQISGLGVAPGTEPAPADPKISIDDFRKVTLKVALVLEAEKVPKSDKLLKLKVSLGNETRQVLAGIAKSYSPEDIIGKKVVVVANLLPAKLMGHESQGMVLAAENSEGKLNLVEIPLSVPEGTVVK